MQKELSERFAYLAIENKRKLEEGKIKSANKLFEKLYVECGSKLRGLQDQGKSILLELVMHEDAAVRMHAAYFLLPLNEALALRTLLDVHRLGIPWVSSSSKTTVDEWRKGTLDTSWFVKDG